MRKRQADDDRDAHHRPRDNRQDSIPSFPARLPHLKSARCRDHCPPGRLVGDAGHPQHAPLPGTCFLAIPQSRGKAMAAVHYYLGRPARGSASRPIHAAALRGKHATAADPSTAASPASPQADSPLLRPLRRTAQPIPPRAAPGNRKPPATTASGLPPDAAPAGGLLARRRIAIARFGTDVAAAGGIGPALTAGLDPADYPVVPGGVPQAWERAQVYLGLCERYQELYQAQVAEMHLLMATVPGCSLPLSHCRPLTSPLTDTHSGYTSLIRGARLRAPDPMIRRRGMRWRENAPVRRWLSGCRRRQAAPAGGSSGRRRP